MKVAQVCSVHGFALALEFSPTEATLFTRDNHIRDPQENRRIPFDGYAFGGCCAPCKHYVAWPEGREPP